MLSVITFLCRSPVWWTWDHVIIIGISINILPSEGLTDLHLLTLYMKAALNSLSPQLQVFISPRLVLAMSGPTSCQVSPSSL